MRTVREITPLTLLLPVGALFGALPFGIAGAQERPRDNAQIAAQTPGQLYAQSNAQSNTPDITTTGILASGNGPECQSQLALATRAAWPGASVTALSAPVARTTRFGTTTPVMVLDVQSPQRHAWRWRASGTIGHAEEDCVELSGRTRLFAQLVRTFGQGGVGLSYGHRSLSSLDPSRDRQGVTLSAWQRIRRWHIAADVRAHDRSASFSRQVAIDTPRLPGGIDTLATWPRDTTYRTETSQVSLRSIDLRARLQFPLGRMLLDLTAGRSMGQRMTVAPSSSFPGLPDTMRTASTAQFYSQHWGRLDAYLPVTRWLTLTGGAAVLPAQPGLASPMRGIYSVGVGVSRWPGRSTDSDSDRHGATTTARFEAVRRDSLHVHLRLRTPGASSVRISGEPTHWTVLSMTRANDGWWEATLAVAPGIYRMNVSIDGSAWRPPPGVPVARDEFGGLVGLVTLE